MSSWCRPVPTSRRGWTSTSRRRTESVRPCRSSVANMTAISGRRMAETIARRGGITILPQDIPGEVVGDAVAWVKARHPVFETPIKVAPETVVAEVLALLGKRSHGAAVVLDRGRPVGIVTEHDCVEVDRFTRVSEVMTTDLMSVGKDQDLYAAFDLMTSHHLDVAPVLDGDQMLGVLTRKGILRSAIYRPALDAARPADGGRGHGRERRCGGEGRRPAQRAQADVLVRRHGPRPPGTDARGAAARSSRLATSGRARPVSGFPSSPATWSRPTAHGTWPRPAPTSSRSGSVPERCARPG